MESFAITEAQIREFANAQSFKRGADYQREGAVVALIRRGNILEAEVEGSSPEPYRISITLADGKLKTATCDCEYDYDGWCKHIVAALLAALRTPDEVEERTPISDLLADRDRDDLLQLTLRLVEKYPEIVADIEKWAVRKPKGQLPGSNTDEISDKPALDPKPYQKQMKTILRSIMRQAEEYYSEEEPLDALAEEAGELLDEAKELIAAGQARNGAVILQAITDEIVGELDDLASFSSGESEFFSEIGSIWIETMLAGTWSANEKAAWTKRLKQWHLRLNDWGAEGTFEAASVALEQGWDFPPLTKILSGESRDWLALSGNDPDTALVLAQSRIEILRRQARLQEAANLARTAGLHREHAEILIALNQPREAVEYAREKLTSIADLLKIALLLADKGAAAEAIAVGAQGLNSEKPATEGYRGAYTDSKLAEWMLDYARENGEPKIALRAGIAFVRVSPSLTTWKKLVALAGSGWNDLRTELLADLLARGGYDTGGRADIFLHEGLYAEAVSLVRKTVDYQLIGRVADAALPHVPQEVLEISRERAEEIMDGGRSNHYAEAAQWLQRAKTAYMTLNAASEWQTYILSVKNKHERKRNLMPLIKNL